MSNYTAKNVGGKFEISRGEEHVATYDAVGESLTWVKDEYKKYQNHVMRVVKNLDNVPEDEPEDAPPVEKIEDTPAPAPAPELSVAQLKNLVKSLQMEIATLRDTIAKQNKSPSREKEPERFSDKIDLSKAPLQDPNLGDLTPAFIEWARENMPKEIFVKRYKNRGVDLN
jgi:hypothetical protein